MGATQDGLLDPSFGANDSGRLTHAFNLATGSKRDAAQAVFVRGDRYLVVGRVDPAGEGKVRLGLLTLDREGTVRDSRSLELGITIDEGLDQGGLGLRFGEDAQDRLYVAGRFQTGNPITDVARIAVTRLTPALAVDATYGNAGVATVASQFDASDVGGQAFDLAVDADGSLAVVGHIVRANSTNAFVVARLRPDGSPDTAFAGGRVEVRYDVTLSPSALANRVVIDMAGRLVVGGVALDGTGSQGPVLARLLRDGTLDQTFCPSAGVCDSPVLNGRRFLDLGGGSSGASTALFAIAPLPDGGFAVAGETPAPTPGGDIRCVVMRLRADGGVDQGFGNAGRREIVVPDFDCASRSLLVGSDGRLTLIGHLSRFVGVQPQGPMIAVRLLPGGEFDPDFSRDDTGAPSAITRLQFSFGSFDEAVAGGATFDEERIVIVGARRHSGSAGGTEDDLDFAIARLRGGAVFADSMEARRAGR